MDMYKDQEVDGIVVSKGGTKKGNHHAYDIQPLGLAPIKVFQSLVDERDPHHGDGELKEGGRCRVAVKFVPTKPDVDNFGEMLYSLKARIIPQEQSARASG